MSKSILAATAIALLVGVSAAAIAQSGSDVRKNDRKIEKALDNRELIPIRPIRRVGPNDWPAGNPAARVDKPEDNVKAETTGQAPQDSTKQERARGEAKQEPVKPEPPKQDQAKQDGPKQDATRQDQAKQEPPKQETPKQEAKQDAANPQGQQPMPKTEQAQQPQNNAPPNNPPQQAVQQQQNQPNKQDNFASIRLGTDAQGRVAVNQQQERQIFSALRRQHLRPADVSVTIGAKAPADVRLGAVSADIVAVLPQFRGYSFFATRDELVIVEPTDRKVVALVPLNGSELATRPQRERNTERTERNSERSAERASKSRPPRADIDPPRNGARDGRGRGAQRGGNPQCTARRRACPGRSNASRRAG